jgi:enolase-phosphatase E1
MPAIRGILLDIEGTTSSISFVYDMMFPYVREHLDSYLSEHWGEPDLQESLATLLAEYGEHQGSENWLAEFDDTVTPADLQAAHVKNVNRLMDSDVKAPGLKKLQGMIWEKGFKSGEMVAHLFDDVEPALKRWTEAGIDLRIYSSGSIQAQKLFFGHTVKGDLLPCLTRHYDRSYGPKHDRTSYHMIASDYGVPANRVLFVSDVVAELDAANEARMQVALSVRPGNKPVENPNGYPVIESFDQLDEIFSIGEPVA